MRRRETIHLSLGPTANAVTTHLLNLEGLSVTSTTAAAGTTTTPVCDPVVTHRVDSATNPVWVPRVLLVDESHRIQQSRTNIISTHQPSLSSTSSTVVLSTTTPSQTTAAAAAMTTTTWSGVVQEFNMETFSLDDFMMIDNNNNTTEEEAVVLAAANQSWNSNNNVSGVPIQQQQAWLSSWHQTSSQLAYAPYSQYRVSPEQLQQQSPYYYQQQQPQQTQLLQQEEDSRYVDWDNLGDEEPEEEDEEEQAALRERKRRKQMSQWNGERQQLEEQLSHFWQTQQPQQQERPSPNDSQDQIGKTSAKASSGPSLLSDADLEGLSWMDYWMPPRPSPLTQCTYGLPSTSAASSLEAPPLHAFHIGTTNTHDARAILDDVWETVRLELERTDACQGFRILTEGSGIYAGMANWLLQELQQECRAAGRWVFHVADQNSDDDNNNKGGQQQSDQENAVPHRRSTELAMAQARIRNHVQRGLALAGLSEKAHAVVPLMLPSRRNNSLFRASAELAMALETAMLPYRCRSSSASSSDATTLVGWNSMSGYEEGTSPSGMSLGDYLTTIQPSPRYSVLELDTVMTPDGRNRLGQVLVSGTSVERDPRVRRPPRSLGVDYPGSWLLDEQFGTPSGSSLGILTSLSPGHVAQEDRSLHHHFGLSACLRRNLLSDSTLLTNNQQYLTCLMEGMGVRYRPETSFGLVTNQSLSQLTATGHRYGAGSYWKYLLGAGIDVPVLSVLGNTTRMYPHLHAIAKDMKEALKSPKTQGYYQREVSSGILPELDDCDEALEKCFDLRDVYEPPNGSGLLDNYGDDGNYIDE